MYASKFTDWEKLHPPQVSGELIPSNSACLKGNPSFMIHHWHMSLAGTSVCFMCSTLSFC